MELDSGLPVKLSEVAHSQRATVRPARRCVIVLLADDGYESLTIADMLRVGRIHVARWPKMVGVSDTMAHWG